MIQDFLYRREDFNGKVSLGLGTGIIYVSPFDVLPFQFHHIGKVHPSGIEAKNKIVFAVQKLWIFRKVNIDYLFYFFKGKGPFGSPSFQSRYFICTKGIK